MAHMILELVLWMLLAFFIGCIVGYLARRILRPNEIQNVELATVRGMHQPAPPVSVEAPPEPPKVTMEPVEVITAAPVAAPVERASAPTEPVVTAAALKPERPKGIAEPREGKADNLQRISGVGPKYERTLHNLGFYHYDQIAVWTTEQVGWIDDHLKFNGRIQREEWVVQAKLLADGREEEFSSKYEAGGSRAKAGESKPGTRTRRR